MRYASQPTFLALATAALLIVLAGCSEDGTGTPNAYDSGSQTIDLNDPYGGFLPTDEDPAFGDATLAERAGDEERVADGYAGLTVEQMEQVSSYEEDPRTEWYSFTAVWGNLSADRNSGTPEDPPQQQEEVVWDGSLELTRGGIKLLSIILFEREHGDRLLPRAVPERIEWASRTYGHYDGLRVLLAIPPDTARVEDPVELTLHAGDYERVFTLAELDSLHEEIEVGENATISLRAFQADPEVDVRGFLGGAWGKAVEDSVGHFRGRWIAARDGRLMGWLRGHYGVDEAGEQVFFGKYIDWSGRFRGLLRGHYELMSSGEPGSPGYREYGEFWGEWIGRQGQALGRLNGTWSRRGNGRGRFHGMWRGNVLTPMF
ncbi:MAG: hypothetical protein GF330_04630 [Candidatus Eisenbacteria bacterium]|nr:hypothetical protein [Candidatus Eisenbacteria bacterium]